MIPPIKSNFLPLLLFLYHSLQTITPTNAFAAWLVDRPIGCFTFLEPDEVIMNNKVLDVTSSKNPNVYLEMYDKKKNEKIRSEDVHADKEVIIGTNNGKEEESMEYQILMMFPPEIHDAQYVLDVTTKSYSNPEEESETLKAVFVNSGKIGCEGKRGHGRSKGNGLTLQIKIDGNNNNNNNKDTVEVWGGWATDHEAVSLTPKIIFKQQQSQEEEEEKGNKITNDVDTIDERKTREEEAKTAMKKLNDLRLNMGHNLSPEEVHASQIGVDGGDDKRKEDSSPQKGGDDTAQQQQQQDSYYTKFNQAYQKQQKFDDLNIMSSSSFWCGALLMCFYIACFMRYANVAGMRFQKGRRDL